MALGSMWKGFVSMKTYNGIVFYKLRHTNQMWTKRSNKGTNFKFFNEVSRTQYCEENIAF